MATATNLMERSMVPKDDTSDAAKPADKQRYLRAIGSIMYIYLRTMPEIGFALSHLAQFCQDPSIADWKALKRLM